MRTGRVFTVRMALAALAILAIADAVRADVVILKKGDRQEGIVTPAPGKPDFILLRNYKTRLEIQRDRITSIEEEPDSVDWRRIGDQFFNERLYQNALEAYRKSASFDPADAKTAEQIRAAELALQREATLDRRKQIESINAMLDDAAAKVDAKKFEDAEGVLMRDVLSLNPTDEQQKRILDLKKALYKGWALEMEDKLRSNDAAKYFEKLLALDPLDKDAYDRLVVIWEKDPDKTAQVINAHLVHLKLDPGDNKIRRKLADKYVEYAAQLESSKGEVPDRARRVDALYASAVEQYELLAAGQENPHPEIAKALSTCLTNLSKRSEQRADYDNAIAYYKHLQKYSDKAGDEALHRLEYRRDYAKINPKDADALTTLALRAGKQGLVDIAHEEIWRLKKQFPDNACVNQALTTYAKEALGMAWDALRKSNFEQADALAVRASTEYNFIPGIAEEAERIQNQAKVELEKYRRTVAEQGRKYKELGDTAFYEGKNYMNNMRNNDLNQSVRVFSDKTEAVTKFQLAVQYYTTALSIWTNMDAASREEIRVNFGDAQRFLNQLTNPTPLEMGSDLQVK
jgi:hypothetical protein